MRQQSVVSLDPIDRSRKKQDSIIGRFFKTRHLGGSPIKKTAPIGHYMFCGKQRSGKTVSMLWYCEQLVKKYEKKGFKVIFFSNFGVGRPLTKYTISPAIRAVTYNPKVLYIFMIDEIQSYFPKDTKESLTCAEIDKLTGDFSQLAKKNIYVLSTAQVYGRVNKNLREQCLYMVACRPSMITNKVVNDFIPSDDIMCDDLGRWSGVPTKIYVHGLPKARFDTHRMITE